MTPLSTVAQAACLSAVFAFAQLVVTPAYGAPLPNESPPVSAHPGPRLPPWIFVDSRDQPAATEVTTSGDFATLEEQVRGLKTELSSEIASMRPAWWERFVPAAIGFIGVLLGGLLGLLQQGRQMKLSEQLQREQLAENERVGQAKAGYESLSKVIDYQTRQVNEFYSPLRLMLRRSSGVRRQLCDQLQTKVPQRFIFVRETDGRDHLYVAAEDGSKVRFRLIEHMHELATAHPEFLPLVEEIVSIGNAMSELVYTKGGMALTDSDRLTVLLGRYLAHFSILRDVAKKATQNPETLATVQYNVAYPTELDAALDEDATALTRKIEDWKILSRQMWQRVEPALPSSA